MSEGIEQAPVEGPTQRHIIRRPRLERLLDETDARVILLVAPAGYGKTTLLRQWVDARDGDAAWFTASHASRDIAVLTRNLLSVLPGVDTAQRRVDRLLRAAADVDSHVDELAEAIIQALTGSETDLLVIDDYHELVGSSAAELVLARVAAETRARLLLASRERPSWLSARDIVYGTVAEIGRAALAMDSDETAAVLGNSGSTETRALAGGWPAVVGLAAMTGLQAAPESHLPDHLHDFLAEEVLRLVPAHLRVVLCSLAYAPVFSETALECAAGGAADDAVARGLSVGFLDGPSGELRMHGLTRAFLRVRAQREGVDVADLEKRLVRVYLDSEEWDAAREVAANAADPEALVQVLSATALPLLSAGRMQTLAAWLHEVRIAGASAAVLDVIDAEISLRLAQFERAYARARAATASSSLTRGERFRAFIAQGRAAHFTSREAEGLQLFKSARSHASDERDVWEALWGAFNAAVDVEDVSAAELLRELESLGRSDPDGILRLCSARILHASRAGGVQEAIAYAQQWASDVDVAKDPFVTSAYLHALAHGLALSGRYDAALQTADAGLARVETDAVPFAVPHFEFVRASALAGQRRYAHALEALQSVETQEGGALFHTRINVEILRSRILLAKQRVREARGSLTSAPEEISTPSQRGEYLAAFGLVALCGGDREAARESAVRATRTTADASTQLMVQALELGLASGAVKAEDRCAELLLTNVARAGIADPVVAAYRALPAIVEPILRQPRFRLLVTRMLDAAHDQALVEGGKPTANLPLSPREIEVLRLIAQGLSNQEIAQKLFISIATVKAHVRHVFEKLGVQSRTQAALRARDYADA